VFQILEQLLFLLNLLYSLLCILLDSFYGLLLLRQLLKLLLLEKHVFDILLGRKRSSFLALKVLFEALLKLLLYSTRLMSLLVILY